jgi:oligoribonuclease NrnB/cAMP/cGMP phosphodiesterase (DHH superfamily)
VSVPLVIYHGNCPDGFTAAWVAARALGEVELFAAKYGEPPPYALAKDRSVYVLDFSYPRAQLEALYAEYASVLIVLDHHKTAQAELEGLAYCTFDMQRSGASLTWDYFHPGRPDSRPWIVNYVEDRDLWRFKLPWSEEISLRIRLTPHELAAWDELAARPLLQVRVDGEGAKRYLDHYVQDAMRNVYPLEDIDGLGHRARCVNVSYTGVSDVLHAVLHAADAAMAIGWHIDLEGKLACSVRSNHPFDCSAFAKSLGGGGHAQAAGFRLTREHPVAKRLMGAA